MLLSIPELTLTPFTSSDWLGIALGFAFVFAVLGAVQAVQRLFSLDTFVTRKLVHIAVSHWWLIAWYYHDAAAPALVGPVVFTALNYLDYRLQILPGLDSEGSKGNYGAVLFPVSLIFVTLVTFGGPLPVHAGAAAIFVLGYGDGLAALFGRRFGKRAVVIFGTTKTVFGSLTMVVVSTTVLTIIAWTATAVVTDISALPAVVGVSLLVAGAATIAELLTPLNLDNLTIPLVTLVMYAALAL